MTSTRLHCLLACTTFLLAACGNAAGASAEVERADSAGIEIVTSPGEDRPLEWRFEEVLRLGGADNGPEAFGQVQVGTDARGNLYVLDASQHRVIAFDATGRHRWTAGGRGGGPGELQFPLAFSVSPDGVSHVFDPSKTGFVRWDADGGVLPDLRSGIRFFGGRLVVLGDGVAFEGQGRADDPATLRSQLVYHPWEGEDRTVASIDNTMRGPIRYPGCAIEISGQPEVLAPRIVWDAGDDRVALNRQPWYDVHLVEGGETRRILRRDLEPRRAGVQDATLVVDNPMVMRGGAAECRIPASDVVETRGIAERVPTIFQIRMAPDGALWVNRQPARAGERRIDVFDPEGAYLGTLPPDAPFPAAFTPEGHPVVVERDDFDLPYMVVYRVDRG
jgi:hypothetical protein